MTPMMQPGVYMILNLVTDARYVGSTSQSLSSRWAKHKSQLRKGNHGNPPLQAAWNAHGSDAFRFVILENIDPPERFAREQHWMDLFTEQGYELYNRCPEAASHKGLVMPAYVSEQLRQRMKGRVVSEETRAKLSAAHKGRKNPGAAEALAHDWPPIVSPDGTVYEVHNLLAFCREHGLDISALRKVVLGTRSNHRGWTRLGDRSPAPYNGPLRVVGASRSLIAPDGTIYENITNLEAFGREHGVDPSALRRVIKGEYRTHHGWSAPISPSTCDTR